MASLLACLLLLSRRTVVLMARFEAFDRELRLATEGLEPDALNKALAAFAKREVRKLISSGQASANYERYVNNQPGLPEEAVVAPGPIVYDFVNWSAIIRTALEELQKRVPRKSGRYAGGFMVLANGHPVREYKAIPTEAEVIIFNTRPYTRKMEVGGNKTGAKHFDAVRRLLATRYRDVFEVGKVRFLDIGGGLHPDVPYILKGEAPLVAAKKTRRSSAFRAGRATLARDQRRQAGMPIAYPAIIINAV